MTAPWDDLEAKARAATPVSFENAKESRPVDDPRALVGFGWAPGDYIGVCGRCGEPHISEKRAMRCQDCAEALAAVSTASQVGIDAGDEPIIPAPPNPSNTEQEG